jgi:hypothetical protein
LPWVALVSRPDWLLLTSRIAGCRTTGKSCIVIDSTSSFGSPVSYPFASQLLNTVHSEIFVIDTFAFKVARRRTGILGVFIATLFGVISYPFASSQGFIRDGKELVICADTTRVARPRTGVLGVFIASCFVFVADPFASSQG